MALYSTSDVCTLMWPFLEKHEPIGRENSWLIGWNPRGLVIVVVTLVHSNTFEDALELLNFIIADAESHVSLTKMPCRRNVPNPSQLLVLGRLSALQPSSGAVSESMQELDVFVRNARQRSDIWIELKKGPVLDQLWCCGYSVQPCHLHVIRTDPLVRYSTSPTVFSVNARFGCKGVAELLRGKEPLCVAGAHSTLEGVLLPPHMIPLAGPSVSGHQKADAKPLPRTFFRRVKEESCDSNASVDDLRRSNSSLHQAKEEQLNIFSDADDVEPIASLPPRLDFPTSANSAELSLLLQSVNFGRALCKSAEHRKEDIIKRKNEGEGRSNGDCENNYSNTACGKNGASGKQNVFEKYFHRAVGILIFFLLRVISVLTLLGKISFVAALLEFRFREFSNWLLLLQGNTPVCALHPVLPHMIHDDVSFKRFCAYNYLVRFLFDGALGVLLSLLLAVGESALILKSNLFCTYFLYDVHMNYMDWFEGWPAGLKMNDDLNMTLCFFAKLFLRLSWNFVVKFNWVKLAYKLLIYISPIGASCAFALVADICVLATLHIMLLSQAVSFFYRLMLFVIDNLFLQLRGKKYNPLRCRTDAYEFGVNQMLMGTLLFTVTVFLFPTLAVYYLYFAFARVSILILKDIFVAAGYITLYLPLFPVIYWVMNRRKWPGGFALATPKVTCVTRHSNVVGSEQQISATVDVTAYSKPLKLQIFLEDFFLVLSTVVRLRPFYLLKVIFCGELWETTNPVERLFPQFRKYHIDANAYL